MVIFAGLQTARNRKTTVSFGQLNLPTFSETGNSPRTDYPPLLGIENKPL